MNLKKNLPLIEIQLKMEFLCSYQERCEYDIWKKLENYELTNEEKNEIISYLLDAKFIDQQRYAEAYVRGKVNLKRDGIQKIKYALYSKKIDAKIVENALKTIQIDLYSDNIESLITKKYPILVQKNDAKTSYQKTIQYLLSKGYNYAEIKSKLEDYINSQKV